MRASVYVGTVISTDMNERFLSEIATAWIAINAKLEFFALFTS